MSQSVLRIVFALPITAEGASLLIGRRQRVTPGDSSAGRPTSSIYRMHSRATWPLWNATGDTAGVTDDADGGVGVPGDAPAWRPRPG